MLRAILLLSLGSFFLCSQTAVELFKKAPPSVDDALRARVNEFYQYHVDKKFRKADALVAEESKDMFYAALKQEPLSFKINEIQYEENFTKAKVMSLLKVDRGVPFGGGIVRMDLPVQSYWKVIDGQWFFYLPERPCRPTPMGPCRAFTPEELEAAKQQTALKEQIQKAMEQAKAGEFNKWEVTPRELELEAKTDAKAEVKVKNSLNGYLTLEVRKISGPEILETTVPSGPIAPDQEGRVQIKVKDAAAFKETIRVSFIVQPFNRVEQITVSPKK